MPYLFPGLERNPLYSIVLELSQKNVYITLNHFNINITNSGSAYLFAVSHAFHFGDEMKFCGGGCHIMKPLSKV